jgi:uncharacterized 2Fe-2S/4Fe-4S cluster protein (DUF4445 family)
MPKLNTCLVDFEPIGKRIEVKKGISILDAAREAGIDLIAICGGSGTCGQCKVQVKNKIYFNKSFSDKKVFTDEQIEKGWCLACKYKIFDSIKVFIPQESLTTKQRLQIENNLEKLEKISMFTLEKFNINSDLFCAFNEHQSVSKNSEELKNLISEFCNDKLDDIHWGEISRTNEELDLVRRNGTPIYIGQNIKTVYGLAIDLGTTKIAAYLVDLITGVTVAKSSTMNPQISYGEDVISRIMYCNNEPEGSENMKKLVVAAINELCKQMCDEIGAEKENVIEAVIVGNTAMHHLTLKLPVKQLGLSPYRPYVTHDLLISANTIGLEIACFGKIFLPGNIAGFIGGDHLAMMIATDAKNVKGNVIFIDIGTNTEVTLVHNHELFSCSCASGPAFEGAHIKNGMRAGDGAIERVIINGDEIQYKTIGNIKPIGLCGSGILDSVSQLKKNKIIDERGRFLNNNKKVKGEGKYQEFVLVESQKTGTNHPLVINRKDINEILLAKAAIQTGISILLRSADIKINEIDRLVVAGAFGSYLDLQSAIDIGMLPKIEIDKYQQVGNAAGFGAKQLLLSENYRRQTKELVEITKYIELTSFDEFQKVFLESLKFDEFK